MLEIPSSYLDLFGAASWIRGDEDLGKNEKQRLAFLTGWAFAARRLRTSRRQPRSVEAA